MLGRHRHRAERAAQGKAAGVAHETRAGGALNHKKPRPAPIIAEQNTANSPVPGTSRMRR